MYKYEVSLFQLIISVLLLFITNFLIKFLSVFINNQAISYIMIISLTTAILFYLNFDLIKSHFLRYTKYKDKVIFLFLGIILFLTILITNKFYLDAFIYQIDATTFYNNIYFSPIFLLTFSLFYSIIFGIIFKLVTNFFKIYNKELLFIIISGLLVGTIFSLSLFPISIFIFIKNLILYFLLSLIFSYLYNQTTNIINPMLSLTIALLLLNVYNIF